jgi:hypothetical protein
MEGEDRRLHDERSGEREEEEHAGRARQVGVAEGGEVEGGHARLGGVDGDKRHDADQHERRGDKGIDEELRRRLVPLTRLAPPGDEEVHRHERELEEGEEQQDVGRQERPEAAALEDEHPGNEPLLVHSFRRPVQPQGHEHDREKDQKERDAVDAE